MFVSTCQACDKLATSANWARLHPPVTLHRVISDKNGCMDGSIEKQESFVGFGHLKATGNQFKDRQYLSVPFTTLYGSQLPK